MYERIAEEYSELFPYDPSRGSFIIDLIGSSRKNPEILDIGCAAGDLAYDLADRGCLVTAIDLDETMIRTASKRIAEKNIGNPVFKVKDMTGIAGTGPYDAILCFGNTLPHLKDEKQLETVLEDILNCLNPGGVFIFQIINFNILRSMECYRFPDIETENSVFTREYIFRSDGKIDFNITLTDKKHGTSGSGSTILLPLLRVRLVHMLSEKGFSGIRIFSDYSKTEADGSEAASIYTAIKMK